MTATIKNRWARMNKVLTTLNGFLFGVFVQFPPLHPKGNAREIPIMVNLLLLMVLTLALVAAIITN